MVIAEWHRGDRVGVERRHHQARRLGQFTQRPAGHDVLDVHRRHKRPEHASPLHQHRETERRSQQYRRHLRRAPLGILPARVAAPRLIQPVLTIGTIRDHEQARLRVVKIAKLIEG